MTVARPIEFVIKLIDNQRLFCEARSIIQLDGIIRYVMMHVSKNEKWAYSQN